MHFLGNDNLSLLSLLLISCQGDGQGPRGVDDDVLLPLEVLRSLSIDVVVVPELLPHIITLSEPHTVLYLETSGVVPAEEPVDGGDDDQDLETGK